MSKEQKLIAQLQSEPPEASFSDVKRVLKIFGFLAERSSGSHHAFRHPDGRIIIVPLKSGRKVKRVYVKQVLALLGLDNECK